jgi:hypothetical protein
MHDRFIFISTLDGKLTALNTADGGTEAWEFSTEPGALLSSSIDQLEVKKWANKQAKMIYYVYFKYEVLDSEQCNALCHIGRLK